MLKPPICPTCSTPLDIRVFDDIEITFNLPQTAQLLDITVPSLRTLLQKHPEVPARYKFTKGRKRMRVLYASEVRFLRDIRLWYGSPKRRMAIMTRSIDMPDATWSYPTIDETEARKNIKNFNNHGDGNPELIAPKRPHIQVTFEGVDDGG